MWRWLASLCSNGWPRAVEEARLALAIDPRNSDAKWVAADALTNLGLAAIADRRLDAATSAFEQAVQFQPESGDAQLNLANALVEGGRARDALAHARRAAALLPNNSGAYDVLGRALAGTGQRDEARAQFERALRINPADEQAREDLEWTVNR